MNAPLPPEVRVSEDFRRTRYRLPLRPLGAWHGAGLALLLFGLALAALPFSVAARALSIAAGPGPGDAGPWFLATVPSLLALVIGAPLARIGLLILAGHSEVELRDGTLRAVERCGPVRRSRSHDTAGLRRFFVSELLPQIPFLTEGGGPLSRLCVITPEWQPALGSPTTKPLWLAPGYPRPWLVVLADNLARRCAAPALPSALDPAPVDVSTDPAIRIPTPHPEAPIAPPAVVQRSPALTEYEELYERPAGSKIILDESEDRLTLIVPPAFSQRNQNWYGGGICLCLFALVLTGNAITKDLAVALWSALFAVLAWATGIGVLAVGFDRARRRVVFDILNDRLFVWQSGFLRVRRRQWRRSRLADVYVLHHHGHAESAEYAELRIEPHPGAGEAVELLAHRDEAELRWLATVLRRRLRCPGHPDRSPPPGLVVRPQR